MTQYDVLIVGAGQAGAQVAMSLRMANFEGSIALIGAEPDAPYERPPLSKDYLAGEKTAERLQLRPADFWTTRNIELRLGERVTAVDAAAHSVTTDRGVTLGYRHLVWATGGPPRALPVPGGDLAGVHVIRTRADVDTLRAEAETATNIIIVGGGYIGLEAAAVLSKAGKHVTVLEAMDRVLARVAGEPVSRFYEAQHRAHGVTIVLGAKIEVPTATGRVRDDIIKHLKLRDTQIFVASFNRPNLTYRVIPKDQPSKQIIDFIRKREHESGIVYCIARKSAESVAEFLHSRKVKALAYHAGREEAGQRARRIDGVAHPYVAEPRTPEHQRNAAFDVDRRDQQRCLEILEGALGHQIVAQAAQRGLEVDGAREHAVHQHADVVDAEQVATPEPERPLGELVHAAATRGGGGDHGADAGAGVQAGFESGLADRLGQHRAVDVKRGKDRRVEARGVTLHGRPEGLEVELRLQVERADGPVAAHDLGALDEEALAEINRGPEHLHVAGEPALDVGDGIGLVGPRDQQVGAQQRGGEQPQHDHQQAGAEAAEAEEGRGHDQR